jgi:hypothetical protein
MDGWMGGFMDGWIDVFHCFSTILFLIFTSNMRWKETKSYYTNNSEFVFMTTRCLFYVLSRDHSKQAKRLFILRSMHP